METRFADRLELVMKVLALSRGQLAVALAVDKSLVSRWLTGSSEPGNHNLARLTAYVAERAAGFTMLDWEADLAVLGRRLGLAAQAPAPSQPPVVQVPDPLLPDFASLRVFAAAHTETAQIGRRFCGLWRSTRPMLAHPRNFSRDHVHIWFDGDWLKACVWSYQMQSPALPFITNKQLYLLIGVQNDLMIMLFNRVDEHIVDQVDGIILSSVFVPGQRPSASRVFADRLLDDTASREVIDAELAARVEERRVLEPHEVDDELRRFLLADFGPAAAAQGGERVLRAAPPGVMTRGRWV